MDFILFSKFHTSTTISHKFTLGPPKNGEFGKLNTLTVKGTVKEINLQQLIIIIMTLNASSKGSVLKSKDGEMQQSTAQIFKNVSFFVTLLLSLAFSIQSKDFNIEKKESCKNGCKGSIQRMSTDNVCFFRSFHPCYIMSISPCYIVP